jgi:predicted signal transduction protein with EAL and GGDEF domain
VKILLADDDRVSRHVLQRILERSGFEAVCVDNGQAAVDLLTAPDGPRVAILDWVMPGKNGPAVCREVRASIDTPYVYMILLTARDASLDIVTGLGAGADDYLIKPSNPEELKARLRTGQRILELQDKLIHEARYDALTTLPNRAFFVKRLAECVRKCQQPDDYQFALLFIDIDRFKSINDSLGHTAGDELMRAVARRLQHVIRTESLPSPGIDPRRTRGGAFDSVARIGGDEFVILLENFAGAEDGARVARRIQTVLEKAFHIENHQLFITASIGIAISGKDTIDPAEMLRNADAAMYKAKLHGKARFVISDSSCHGAALSRFRLENDLRDAILNHELELHYQPIVSIDDCHIRRFEALIRWRHPVLGMVQPDAFVSIAEETGLILPIGEWVLREACRQMHEWNLRFAAAPPVCVCVNISPRQFADQNLVKMVRTVLDETGLDPKCLELEVTENLTMQDSVRAMQILRELASLGISLSLDDFGTGCSSLSYLHRFPITTLKIDRSFIREIESCRESAEIVQTIAALGHNLGMEVVAEGIETTAQLDRLRALKVDYGQGFLFSRPISAHSATLFLEAKEIASRLEAVHSSVAA